MIDATYLITAVCSLIGVIITYYLIPYLKSKTSKETQEVINNWVKIAVTAAEQIYTGVGRGEEKKQYVIAWLNEHGIQFDESRIDAMIEAAVYELTNNGIFGTLESAEDEAVTK